MMRLATDAGLSDPTIANKNHGNVPLLDVSFDRAKGGTAIFLGRVFELFC